MDTTFRDISVFLPGARSERAIDRHKAAMRTVGQARRMCVAGLLVVRIDILALAPDFFDRGPDRSREPHPSASVTESHMTQRQ